MTLANVSGILHVLGIQEIARAYRACLLRSWLVMDNVVVATGTSEKDYPFMPLNREKQTCHGIWQSSMMMANTLYTARRYLESSPRQCNTTRTCKYFQSYVENNVFIFF